MKQGSKIALLAAGAAALLLAKKQSVSGIGAFDTKYIVRFIPKYEWRDDIPVWVWISQSGRINLQNDRNLATRFDTQKEAEQITKAAYVDYFDYDYKGFEVLAINDHDEERVQRAIDKLLSYDDKMRYRMLSRMKMDCEYYLGNGNRHGQYLWMSMDPQGHIDAMRALWDSFDEKPEWLSREQINQYAEQMGVE